jgi:uncharacterized protein YraI
MKRMATVFGAAVLALGVAAPAMAEYVRLGSVDVGFRTDSDTAYSRFGGRLEGLRLMASRSDIFCRSVLVRYDNGETQNVFSGRLDERRPVEVDLRGRARRVDSISFVCRSDEFRGGRVFVEGEVGRYRDEWRRDRDWDRMWSGIFGGTMGGPDRMGDHDRMGGPDRMGDHDRMGGPDRMGDHDRMGGPDRMGDHDRMGGPGGDWISIGTQSFEGRNDSEKTFASWGGRHVERIGLRPLEADAQCMSIVATFDGGHKVKLADGRTLQRGQMNVYDLPGRERNISSIFLRCRSMSGYHVSIEIFARR